MLYALYTVDQVNYKLLQSGDGRAVQEAIDAQVAATLDTVPAHYVIWDVAGIKQSVLVDADTFTVRPPK